MRLDQCVECFKECFPEEHEAFLIEQDNRCAICKRPTDEFFVDHTDIKVRGLLCQECIYGIEIFNEDFTQAQQYLDKHKAEPEGLQPPCLSTGVRNPYYFPEDLE